MKRTLLTIAVFILGTSLATASFAQGRHDEKPHGSAKHSTEAATRAPATGGRHDEGPYAHSPRKVTLTTPAEAEAKSSPSAGKSNK